jgi:RNA recognition motif-containing protein
MNAPAEEAEAHAKVSKRENRLYVGNLAYDCNYKDLEAFIKPGGLDFLFGVVAGKGWIGSEADWYRSEEQGMWERVEERDAKFGEEKGYGIRRKPWRSR